MQKQDYINETFKLVAILENSGDFIFSQVGLTVKTYSILHLISIGVNTSKDLLNGTYGTKPNISKKLKFLEQNGFIERRIDDFDKRVFRFYMTNKAKKSLKKIGPIYEDSIEMLFSGIDGIDLKKSFGVIRKILNNLLNHEKIKGSLQNSSKFKNNFFG